VRWEHTSLAAQTGLLGFSLYLRPTVHRGAAGHVALWSPPSGSGALLIREVGSGATGHMVASESTSAEGQGPVLQGTWRRVGARHTPCLDLKLVRRGTRSAGTNTFH
jgi:hypothetical protein